MRLVTNGHVWVVDHVKSKLWSADVPAKPVSVGRSCEDIVGTEVSSEWLRSLMLAAHPMIAAQMNDFI